MKNYILKIWALLLILLTLISCSINQDFSVEIEQAAISEFDKDNIEDGFQSPEVFKNCQVDENHTIKTDSSNGRIIIAQEGEIKSNKTKLNYSDIKIHIFKSMEEYSNSEDPEKAFEDCASLWISKVQYDFRKHIIDNKTYYISSASAVEQETPASVFNILCLNNNKFVLITGTLNGVSEIDQKTEEKICKDFSTIES